MSGFEDMINNVFSDPEQMKKLTAMAQSIMGAPPESEASAPVGAAPAAPASGFDLSGLLGKLPSGFAKTAQRFLGGGLGGSGAGHANGGDKTELMNALAPWLSQKRRAKLERSMQMARFLKMGVGVFMKSGGGG